jgi:hypothetical protein
MIAMKVQKLIFSRYFAHSVVYQAISGVGIVAEVDQKQ